MHHLLRLAGFLCLALGLAAAPLGRDLAFEAKLEQQLAAVDPALVPLFRDARIAMDADNPAKSAELLAEVCARAPAFDAAFRRRGYSLVRTGQDRAGLALLERAVELQRSAPNLSSLAQALATPSQGSPARSDLERAGRLLREARAQPDGDDATNRLLSVQIALQLDDRAAARAGVEVLERRFPDLMQTHYFAAVVAAVDERWIRAEDEMRTAGRLGLPEADVRRFLDHGIATRATAWRLTRNTGFTLGAWVLGLVALCLLGYGLSRATLRQIDRADPRTPVSPAEQRLRSIYRSVINIAGIYYYVSLPVVIVVVVLVFGGILYACLAAGFLPVKIAVILVVAAVATIYTMIRSLFLKVQSEDPGRPLSREEAEPLWQLTERVARDLGTRPIDEIRLTPGTDLCVYERGTWREKLDNRAKRVLVLGTAVLNDFQTDAFCSVLAHEYGHFSNRDTAGGDIALRVQNDMMKFYVALLQAGQATWLNLGFHFLRLYNFIFRRITHGATRLQEVLADRVAAQLYGPVAFETGLRHVIRRSIAFDACAGREIDDAIKTSRPLRNLYEPGLAPDPAKNLDEEFATALNRPTTPDDTHPGPLDRFRLIAPIQGSLPPATGSVWELFRDRAALVREMTETIEQKIAPHRPAA